MRDKVKKKKIQIIINRLNLPAGRSSQTPRPGLAGPHTTLQLREDLPEVNQNKSAGVVGWNQLTLRQQQKTVIKLFFKSQLINGGKFQKTTCAVKGTFVCIKQTTW